MAKRVATARAIIGDAWATDADLQPGMLVSWVRLFGASGLAGYRINTGRVVRATAKTALLSGYARQGGRIVAIERRVNRDCLSRVVSDSDREAFARWAALCVNESSELAG